VGRNIVTPDDEQGVTKTLYGHVRHSKFLT
jgi:hypothetical protein